MALSRGSRIHGCSGRGRLLGADRGQSGGSLADLPFCLTDGQIEFPSLLAGRRAEALLPGPEALHLRFHLR
jgi:hypothetical protein